MARRLSSSRPHAPVAPASASTSISRSPRRWRSRARCSAISPTTAWGAPSPSDRRAAWRRRRSSGPRDGFVGFNTNTAIAVPELPDPHRAHRPARRPEVRRARRALRAHGGVAGDHRRLHASSPGRGDRRHRGRAPHPRVPGVRRRDRPHQRARRRARRVPRRSRRPAAPAPAIPPRRRSAARAASRAAPRRARRHDRGPHETGAHRARRRSHRACRSPGSRCSTSRRGGSAPRPRTSSR